MQVLKKALCAVLCLAMLLTVVGCSTPKVAMTVDGKDYSTGEYLAYLYNNYVTLYNNSLYYYEYYGQDIWSQTFTYGEGDDAEQLGLADYLIASTKDTIIRQKAVENMLEEYKLSLSKEDEKDLKEQLASVSESNIIGYGFNKESYSKMFRAYNYNEQTLFYGLYQEGGKREMTKKEIKEYIEKNYLSYRMFSIELVDSEGKELEKGIKTLIADFLKGYHKAYTDGAKIADVFKDYVADLKKGVDLKDEKDKKVATLSWKDGVVTVTLPDAKKSDATKASEKDEDKKEEEPTCDRETAEKSTMDEDLVKAIEKLKEGESTVTSYAAGGSTDTAALLIRYAPLEGKDAVTVKDETKNVIYYAKYEAFDKEVSKAAKALEYTVNDRAIEMCRPEYFDPNYEEGQTTTTTTTTKAAPTTTKASATTTTTTTAGTTTTTTAAK